MKQIIPFIFLLFSFFVHSQNELSTVKRTGDDVFISSQIDSSHEIIYWFKKCMANNLFTFYRVSLCNDSSSVILNEATSDNIGPFEIKNGGWCGGNHLYIDNKTKTAETSVFKLYANGKPVESDTTMTAREIIIEVVNRIFNPLSAYCDAAKNVTFTDTLCTETVKYEIYSNTITVNVSHKYTNIIPVIITKYYGMQSMFVKEHSILTPLGKYNTWTSIDQIGRFRKGEYPQFNCYVEKSCFGYQSTYLFDSGLGQHNELRNDDDVTFIGNSWSKSYHNLISNSGRICGDSDSWRGVYTWFATALLDTPDALCYSSILGGKFAIHFSNNQQGDYRVALPKHLQSKILTICENSSDIKVSQFEDYLYFHCNKKIGSIIIKFE